MFVFVFLYCVSESMAEVTSWARQYYYIHRI